MRKVSFLLALICCFNVFSQTEEIPEYEFFGVPYRFAYISEDNIGDKNLDTAGIQEALCIILPSEEEGVYEWLTRDRVKMKKRISGIFTVYYQIDGDAFVKINNLDHSYIEVVPYLLQVMTYYGIDYNHLDEL